MVIRRRSELNERRRTVGELHRGAPASRGYDWDWMRVARQRREADSWLCQPCLAQGRITASNEVDHIVPIHVRPDWRLEFDNTQVICRCCHRHKTLDDARCYGSSESRVINEDQRCAREAAMH